MLKCDRAKLGEERCNQLDEDAAKSKASSDVARDALRGLAAAIKNGRSLSDFQTQVRDAFEKKFGNGSATSDNLMSAAGWFDKIGTPGTGMEVGITKLSGSLAQVAPGGNLIEIDPGFFATPKWPQVRGFDPWAVILHEAGHGAGLHDLIDDRLRPLGLGKDDGAGDRRAYGEGATNWLGANDPAKAVTNNDNYICFATGRCR